MRAESLSMLRAIAFIAAAVMVLGAVAAGRPAHSEGMSSGTLSVPGPTPKYSGTGLPSLDPDDAKFFGVAGTDLDTLSDVKIVTFIGVPSGTS
ncbi:MAG TPA: hypothetical protein VK723_00145, partial [Thermoplasmata archaeon]|nr:hypothetical protein [Thermoplasmata archaeon]